MTCLVEFYGPPFICERHCQMPNWYLSNKIDGEVVFFFPVKHFSDFVCVGVRVFKAEIRQINVRLHSFIYLSI